MDINDPWVCDSCADGGDVYQCIRPEACQAVLDGMIEAADLMEDR